MAHLWMMGEAGDWGLFPLDADAFALGGARPLRLSALPAAAEPDAAVVLRRVEDPAGAVWALVAPPDAEVLLNGVPAHLGVVVLSDRDEIRAGGSPTLFFSTEALARVVPFPASGPRGFCPRCKQALEPGTLAVQCPLCNLWHHEKSDLKCWTYGPTCTGCVQDTALDAGFRWTPEDL
jgi:hypothetical protein